MSKDPGKAHRPELDNLSHSQIRVVCEELLYTMDVDQRLKFMETFPGLYLMIFPDTGPAVMQVFQKRIQG